MSKTAETGTPSSPPAKTVAQHERVWQQAMSHAEGHIAAGEWMRALPQIAFALETANRVLQHPARGHRSWLRKRSAAMALMTLVVTTLEQQGVRVSMPPLGDSEPGRALH